MSRTATYGTADLNLRAEVTVRVAPGCGDRSVGTSIRIKALHVDPVILAEDHHDDLEGGTLITEAAHAPNGRHVQSDTEQAAAGYAEAIRAVLDLSPDARAVIFEALTEDRLDPDDRLSEVERAQIKALCRC